MKLDDLIKHYETLGLNNDGVDIGYVINNLKEFRILNKPHVDQFIADWYEEHKGDLEFNIWDWIAFRDEPEKTKNEKFNDWLNKGENTSIQTLVKMHLFGYEVKKETKYTVKVKNVQNGTKYLKYDRVIEKWYFGIEKGSVASRLYHTKEELEKGGFGWVFSCEGVEVTEVEEG